MAVGTARQRRAENLPVDTICALQGDKLYGGYGLIGWYAYDDLSDFVTCQPTVLAPLDADPNTAAFHVNRYKIFAYLAQARSHSVGYTPNIGGPYQTSMAVDVSNEFSFGKVHTHSFSAII